MNKDNDAGNNHTRGDKLVYLYKEKKQRKEDDDIYPELYVTGRSRCNDVHISRIEYQGGHTCF